jgi:methylmalonyl-CoA/ethylmalonyl-CoA epimerase
MKDVDLFGDGAVLDHVGLCVSTIGDVLPGDPGIVDPIQKVRVALFQLHGVPLEAVEPIGDDSPVSASLRKGMRLIHLCFRVPDLDAAAAAARSHGLLQVSQPVPAAAFDGRKIVWFFSRVMGLFELVEAPRNDDETSPRG